MDKKQKRKIDVLHQRIQKLQQQLRAAKTQMDDPEDVRRIEAEIAMAEKELSRVREAGSL